MMYMRTGGAMTQHGDISRVLCIDGGGFVVRCIRLWSETTLSGIALRRTRVKYAALNNYARLALAHTQPTRTHTLIARNSRTS